jgi:FkbM family methyltransferase
MEAYRLLADEKSRNIFLSRIALFVGGADFSSFLKFIATHFESPDKKPLNPDEYVYDKRHSSEIYLQFQNDVTRIGDRETLIDGGASIGDSAMEFIALNQRQNTTYRKIICFEPDATTFLKLQDNIQSFDHVDLVPMGLWSHQATLYFLDSIISRPGACQIAFDGSITGTCIQTTSIDDYVKDEDITIIKMDIEGAEFEALIGAKETIRRCQPQLIISAYHKRDDLFKLPLLVKQLNPLYKIYLRHFSNCFDETTLLAIPAHTEEGSS